MLQCTGDQWKIQMVSGQILLLISTGRQNGNQKMGKYTQQTWMFAMGKLLLRYAFDVCPNESYFPGTLLYSRTLSCNKSVIGQCKVSLETSLSETKDSTGTLLC